MKQSILKLLYGGLILFFGIELSAQNRDETSKYTLLKDINYHSSQKVETNEYILERCNLDLYYPKGVRDFATVIWFHGGGIKAGNKFIPDKLKEKGIAVVAVNYRLSPKVKCPVYIEDAAAAVAWVFQNIKNYGGENSKIIISGHSAGGYLTSMIGLDKRYLLAHDIDANNIAMLIPFSGHTITHMTVREENGISDKQPIIDEFAPLFYVREDAPPFIQITGDRNREILGRYEENAYMYRMMKVVGHKQSKLYELDAFDHVGMLSPAFEILLQEMESITN